MRYLFFLPIILMVPSLFGADFYATPDGAGTKSGSSWDHAVPLVSISDTFNDIMEPGDRILLGSGTYSGGTIQIRSGGTNGKPKSVMGVDRGGSLPVLSGSWSIEEPAQGATAIRIEAGISDVHFQDLRIERFTVGVQIPARKEGPHTSRLKFKNIAMAQLRHGYYIADCTDLVLEECTVRRYSKHAFRFEGGCKGMRILRCTADCSEGDREWEKMTELFPFGFFVNQSKRPQSDFMFLDCVARNNVMPLQDRKYKNGDGFVVEESTRGVEFIRCRAIRNQDGGFDLKCSGARLLDCVAVGNSRGFRLWDAGSLSNCIAMRGRVGLWSNGGHVKVERTTFYALTEAAVLTDDDSTDGVTVTDSIIASCKDASRSTAKGSVDLRSTILSDTPGGHSMVRFIDPSLEWDGLTHGKDSRSHPDVGYRYLAAPADREAEQDKSSVRGKPPR